MGDSLNPSAMSRLLDALRPDWSRTVAARRVAAGALVVLAAAAAFRPDPNDERVDIVVAARDLAPGIELTAGDVRVESRSATTIPDGSQSDLAAVVGATLAGPTRRGEVLTDVRLLGSRLAESAAGPNARIVPLHLDDTALLDLIRPGDVVDVLAAGAETGTDPGADARPQVVATEAVVVLVSEPPTRAGGGSDRVVLVALPAHAANEVAGAALVQTVTLTFH
jgi:Flp pilus assembly protein CpaB